MSREDFQRGGRKWWRDTLEEDALSLSFSLFQAHSDTVVGLRTCWQWKQKVKKLHRRRGLSCTEVGLDFYSAEIVQREHRAWNGGNLQDPSLAHVSSSLDLHRLERSGGGGISARNPSVSVSGCSVFFSTYLISLLHFVKTKPIQRQMCFTLRTFRICFLNLWRTEP